MRLSSYAAEPKCPYWYCTQCPEGLTGTCDQAQAEAEAHTAKTSHPTRLALTTEYLIRPADLAARDDLFRARQRVTAGAALLDASRPGWRADVDTAVLTIGSDAYGPLGLLFGSHWEGLDALFGDEATGADQARRGVEHGFW